MTVQLSHCILGGLHPGMSTETTIHRCPVPIINLPYQWVWKTGCVPSVSILYWDSVLCVFSLIFLLSLGGKKRKRIWMGISSYFLWTWSSGGKKCCLMLGRETSRKEGRDRKEREGRKDQGGKRGGYSDRFLVGEEWGNQLVPRLPRTWTPLPLCQTDEFAVFRKET